MDALNSTSPRQDTALPQPVQTISSTAIPALIALEKQREELFMQNRSLLATLSPFEAVMMQIRIYCATNKTQEASTLLYSSQQTHPSLLSSFFSHALLHNPSNLSIIFGHPHNPQINISSEAFGIIPQENFQWFEDQCLASELQGVKIDDKPIILHALKTRSTKLFEYLVRYDEHAGPLFYGNYFDPILFDCFETTDENEVSSKLESLDAPKTLRLSYLLTFRYIDTHQRDLLEHHIWAPGFDKTSLTLLHPCFKTNAFWYAVSRKSPPDVLNVLLQFYTPTEGDWKKARKEAHFLIPLFLTNDYFYPSYTIWQDRDGYGYEDEMRAITQFTGDIPREFLLELLKKAITTKLYLMPDGGHPVSLNFLWCFCHHRPRFFQQLKSLPTTLVIDNHCRDELILLFLLEIENETCPPLDFEAFIRFNRTTQLWYLITVSSLRPELFNEVQQMIRQRDPYFFRNLFQQMTDHPSPEDDTFIEHTALYFLLTEQSTDEEVEALIDTNLSFLKRMWSANRGLPLMKVQVLFSPARIDRLSSPTLKAKLRSRLSLIPILKTLVKNPIRLTALPLSIFNFSYKVELGIDMGNDENRQWFVHLLRHLIIHYYEHGSHPGIASAGIASEVIIPKYPSIILNQLRGQVSAQVITDLVKIFPIDAAGPQLSKFLRPYFLQGRYLPSWSFSWLGNIQKQEMVQALESGLPATLVDQDGVSLFHLALKWGYLDLIQKFLNGGCSPRQRSREGKTPLQYVIAHSQDPNWKKAFELLLSKGASLQGDLTTRECAYLLQNTIISNDIQFFSDCLVPHHCPLNPALPQLFFNPLAFAAQRNPSFLPLLSAGVSLFSTDCTYAGIPIYSSPVGSLLVRLRHRILWTDEWNLSHLTSPSSTHLFLRLLNLPSDLKTLSVQECLQVRQALPTCPTNIFLCGLLKVNPSHFSYKPPRVPVDISKTQIGDLLTLCGTSYPNIQRMIKGIQERAAIAGAPPEKSPDFPEFYKKLENKLKEVIALLKASEDHDWKHTHLKQMDESAKYCPTGWVGAIEQAFSMLHNQGVPTTVSDQVNHILWELRQGIPQAILEITQRSQDRSRHVHNILFIQRCLKERGVDYSEIVTTDLHVERHLTPQLINQNFFAFYSPALLIRYVHSWMKENYTRDDCPLLPWFIENKIPNWTSSEYPKTHQMLKNPSSWDDKIAQEEEVFKARPTQTLQQAAQQLIDDEYRETVICGSPQNSLSLAVVCQFLMHHQILYPCNPVIEFLRSAPEAVPSANFPPATHPLPSCAREILTQRRDQSTGEIRSLLDHILSSYP